MFDQLQPEWGSNLSLRQAMLYAIAFGFTAGLDLGVAILKILRFHADGLEIAQYVSLFVLSLVLARRYYSVALSKGQTQPPPSKD